MSESPRLSSEPRSHRLGRWALPALLALLGVLVPFSLGHWYGFSGIGGADPGMREAAALVVADGEPSPVAPVFPTLIAVLVRLTGLGWDQAGAGLAAVAFVALGPATWLLARRLGASPGLAFMGGLAVVFEPWLALGALQCQPDSMSALAFVLAMLAALAWLRSPGWPRLLVLVLVVGLLPQVREHAPLIVVGLLVLLAVSPGRWQERIGRLLLGLIAVSLAPLLLGEATLLPWDQHWVQLRWGEVVGHFFETGTPDFLSGTPRGYREAFAQAYADGSRLRIAWLHVSLSFHSGWSPWLWLLPGVAGWLLLGRRRWVLLLGFLPLLAVPGGAQQPRHVAVLVPLAAACWVAALPRFRRPERFTLVALTVALGLLCSLNLTRAAGDHRLRCELRGRIAAFAVELCQRTPADAVVVGGNPRPLIYCQRERLPLVEAGQRVGPALWIGPLPQQRRADWAQLQSAGWAPLTMDSDLYPVYIRPVATSAPGPR